MLSDFITRNESMRDSEVAQWAEVLAAERGALSLFPWICTAEGEN